MIEIISVRELRYHSPKEVPIEKEDVIKNDKYYCTIQHIYDKTRQKVAQKTKEVYGEENFTIMWREVCYLYDKEFLNKLISIWKEKVFKKAAKTTEEINPEKEKEKEIIEGCLQDDSIQLELEEYFLSDFWKNTSLASMGTEKK